MMELIPLIIEDVSEKLLGDSPAGAGTQDATHPPSALEVLEDRLLLASDAAVPISAPAIDGAPAEPAAYVAAEHADHGFVDLTSVAAAVDAPADSGQPTHDNSSTGQIQTHAAESHAEMAENQKEQPELRGPEAGEFIEQDVNRNEFGLATIEPQPLKLPQDRELVRELIGDNRNVSSSSLTGEMATAIGAGDTEALADPIAVEVAVKTVADERSTGIVHGTPIPAAVVLDGSGDSTAEQPVKTDIRPEAQPGVPIHMVLQAEPASGAAVTTDASALGNESGKTDAADDNSGAPLIADEVNSPPAAHDALFATGGGAETVLDRPAE